MSKFWRGVVLPLAVLLVVAHGLGAGLSMGLVSLVDSWADQPVVQYWLGPLLSAGLSLLFLSRGLYPWYRLMATLANWLDAARRHQAAAGEFEASNVPLSPLAKELAYRIEVFSQYYQQARIQQAQQQQDFAQMLHDFPYPLVTINVAGEVIEHNQLARQVFPALACGQMLQDYFRSQAMRMAVEELPQQTQEASAEVMLEHDAPGTRYYRTYFMPQWYQEIRSHWLVLFDDVTAEQEYTAEAAEMIANVSHELRTPLTSISGFIENLRDPTLDPAEHEAIVAIIAAQSARMTDLIEGMLTLSRLDAKRALPQTLVDMNSLLRSESDAVRSSAQQQHMRLVNRVPNQPLWIMADALDMALVIRNLLNNALKYAKPVREDNPKRTYIRLELTVLSRDNLEHQTLWETLDHHKEYISIAVIDSGPGIAPQHLPHLTKRFYRADRHRARASTAEGGTGLGLAIAEAILQRHQGRLHIASRLGQGSRFSMIVPRAKVNH